MVDLTNVQLWSEVEKTVVPFDVALVDEADEDLGQIVHTHRVLMVSRGDEKHRFSPNTTEEELLLHVAQMNAESDPAADIQRQIDALTNKLAAIKAQADG